MGIDIQFKRNQFLEIEKESEGRVQRFHSWILDRLQDKLVVSMPLFCGAFVPIPPQTPIRGFVLDDNSIYGFNSIVLETARDGIIRGWTPDTPSGSSILSLKKWLERPSYAIPLMVISPPTNIRRQHQRGYTRIPVDLEARFDVVRNDSPLPVHETLPFFKTPEDYKNSFKYKCRLADISAGGLRMQTRIELSEDDLVRLYLDLKTGYTFGEIYGRVVKVYDRGEDDRYRDYGIEFTAIFESDRFEIIKYTLAEWERLKTTLLSDYSP